MNAARFRNAIGRLEVQREASTSDLIVTLHRTVDAQLDLLRYGLEAAEADAPLTHYSRELALADAIMWGA